MMERLQNLMPQWRSKVQSTRRFSMYLRLRIFQLLSELCQKMDQHWSLHMRKINKNVINKTCENKRSKKLSFLRGTGPKTPRSTQRKLRATAHNTNKYSQRLPSFLQHLWSAQHALACRRHSADLLSQVACGKIPLWVLERGFAIGRSYFFWGVCWFSADALRMRSRINTEVCQNRAQNNPKEVYKTGKLLPRTTRGAG